MAVVGGRDLTAMVERAVSLVGGFGRLEIKQKHRLKYNTGTGRNAPNAAAPT